ncbi:MAG: sigma 54-interacting transcriptional regulator [Polyangiaceae bacterium]|nr:sigma 54-interacting transcriptional regulator [Polyangiaceae bacterium]
MADSAQIPPAGATPSPVTEVITPETGPSLRRIRKLRIVVVDSPDEKEHNRVHSFAQDEVRIGSGSEADVVLSDGAVSREHVAIRLLPDGFLLTDLSSTNGTFVGHLRVREAVLAEETLVRVGKTALRLIPLAETVEHEVSPRASFGRMLGASAAMRETFALLERVAASDLTVLVEGETGTGKELAAEGLHEASGRAGEFVAVNCGAIPRELLESELMGHEKGAFTGAVRERKGAFLAADRGTLFLDEVGELPLDMQAKLLRALERREVKAVGSDRSVSVDVRVVAATNRSLAKEVKAGRFRQDLYYRLAVVTVKIPPLRTRLEDLRLLVDAIWEELARRRKASALPPPEKLDATAMSMLMRYDFRGNVRELRNIVERWAVLGTTVGPGETSPLAPASTREPESAEGDRGASGPFSDLLELPYHEAKDALNERFERAFTETILDKSGGNVSKAARDAGIDRRHLQRMMVRFGVRSTGGT